MNKKQYALVAVLGLFITTLGVTSITSASEGWKNKFDNLTPEQQVKFEERQETWEAKHQAVEDIIANDDYDAWAELMAKQGLADESITPENFAKFKEMHSLMTQSRELMDQAQVLGEEIGLKNIKHQKMMKRHFPGETPPCQVDEN